MRINILYHACQNQWLLVNLFFYTISCTFLQGLGGIPGQRGDKGPTGEDGIPVGNMWNLCVCVTVKIYLFMHLYDKRGTSLCLTVQRLGDYSLSFYLFLIFTHKSVLCFVRTVDLCFWYITCYVRDSVSVVCAGMGKKKKNRRVMSLVCKFFSFMFRSVDLSFQMTSMFTDMFWSRSLWK